MSQSARPACNCCNGRAGRTAQKSRACGEDRGPPVAGRAATGHRENVCEPPPSLVSRWTWPPPEFQHIKTTQEPSGKRPTPTIAHDLRARNVHVVHAGSDAPPAFEPPTE